MNASIMKICADFNSDQLVAIRNFLVSIGEAASEAAADIHK
jgi:hypothetical protein